MLRFLKVLNKSGLSKLNLKMGIPFGMEAMSLQFEIHVMSLENSVFPSILVMLM